MVSLHLVVNKLLGLGFLATEWQEVNGGMMQNSVRPERTLVMLRFKRGRDTSVKMKESVW